MYTQQPKQSAINSSNICELPPTHPVVLPSARGGGWEKNAVLCAHTTTIDLNTQTSHLLLIYYTRTWLCVELNAFVRQYNRESVCQVVVVVGSVANMLCEAPFGCHEDTREQRYRFCVVCWMPSAELLGVGQNKLDRDCKRKHG